jgi:nitrogen regulatory protein PII
MKRIETVITPWTLDAFKEAAPELGISEFDIIEVYRSDCTTNEGRQRLYRGRTFAADLLPRLKLEFVLFDDDVQSTLHQLLELVRPESIGVFQLDQTHRPANNHLTNLPPLRPTATDYPAETPTRQVGEFVSRTRNSNSDNCSAVVLRNAASDGDHNQDRRSDKA